MGPATAGKLPFACISFVRQPRSRRPDGRAAVPRHGRSTLSPQPDEDRRIHQALTGVGYPTILGMYLFTVGTKMTLRAAPKMMLRGFGIMLAKVGTATALRARRRERCSAATSLASARSR